MGNIAVINAIGVRDIARRPLVDGTSALERAIAFGRALPGVEETVLLLSSGTPGPAGLRVIERPSWSVAEMLGVMKSACEGRKDVFYFFGDCPFLDQGIAARMHANHAAILQTIRLRTATPSG